MKRLIPIAALVVILAGLTASMVSDTDASLTDNNTPATRMAGILDE